MQPHAVAASVTYRAAASITCGDSASAPPSSRRAPLPQPSLNEVCSPVAVATVHAAATVHNAGAALAEHDAGLLQQGCGEGAARGAEVIDVRAHLCFLERGKAKQRRGERRTRQRARLGSAEVASRRVGSRPMGSQQGCGCIQHLLRVRSEHGRSYRLTVSRAKLAGRRPGERTALSTCYARDGLHHSGRGLFPPEQHPSLGRSSGVPLARSWTGLLPCHEREWPNCERGWAPRPRIL
eukprot:scaffold97693_cov61-Phaeocystis_antarctica.AAC.5